MKLTTRYQAVLGYERSPAFDCELVCRHCTPLHQGWLMQTVELLEFESLDTYDLTGHFYCLVAFDGDAPRIVLVHGGDWKAIELHSGQASDICTQALIHRARKHRSLWNRLIALIT